LLSNTFKLFGFPIFRFWAYLIKVFPETLCAHYIRYLRFYYYQIWNSNLFDTSCIEAAMEIVCRLSGFRGEDLKKQKTTRNKNCLWRPCLLMERDEMSNLYRGPSMASSCQDSLHLTKQFQRRIFLRNWPTRNKNCLWRPCLLTERDEISKHFRGPSVDASYQVSVHFAKRFQRRRLKSEKFGNLSQKVSFWKFAHKCPWSILDTYIYIHRSWELYWKVKSNIA
jgi:hypothetical protein